MSEAVIYVHADLSAVPGMQAGFDPAACEWGIGDRFAPVPDCTFQSVCYCEDVWYNAVVRYVALKP